MLNKFVYSTIDEQEFVIATERVVFAALLIWTDTYYITGYSNLEKCFSAYLYQHGKANSWVHRDLLAITTSGIKYSLLPLPPFTQIKSLTDYDPKRQE